MVFYKVTNNYSIKHVGNRVVDHIINSESTKILLCLANSLTNKKILNQTNTENIILFYKILINFPEPFVLYKHNASLRY